MNGEVAKRIANLLVSQHRAAGLGAVRLDGKAACEVSENCLLVVIGEPMKFGEVLKTTAVRRLLWERRNDRTTQRGGGTIWAANDDLGMGYIGLGVLVAPGVAERMTKRGFYAVSPEHATAK